MRLRHIVSAEESGLTLHALMRGPLGLSARQTKFAKQKGAVTVDAAPFFANQPVHEGMLVEITLEAYEPTASVCAKAQRDLRVLYEDDAILAVYKPALLQCHPSPSAPGGSDTLEARVFSYLGVPAHPVHRLDAETTGIVLFAKLPYAQARLQRQMQEGAFCKTYQAWVYGIPCPKQGEIDAPIARLTPDSFTRVIRSDGQRAVSRYETLETAILGGHSVSLMQLSPVTGRTHQLRVHMTHIGHPLLGDTRYFSQDSRLLSQALGLAHHQLAAVSLSLIHPITQEPLFLSCPAQFDHVFPVSNSGSTD